MGLKPALHQQCSAQSFPKRPSPLREEGPLGGINHRVKRHCQTVQTNQAEHTRPAPFPTELNLCVESKLWHSGEMALSATTLDLLRNLARKPGHDEVKAYFLELLIQEFGAKSRSSNCAPGPISQ